MLRNSILGLLALFVIVAVSADRPEPVFAHASCNPHSSSWGESRVDLNGDGDQNDQGEYKRVNSEGNNQPPGTTALDAVVGMTNQGGATWRDNRGNTITIGFTTHPRSNPPGSLAGACGGYVGGGTQSSTSSPQTITASTTSVSFTSYVRVCTDISGCGGNYNLGPSIGVRTMSAPTPPAPTPTPPPASQAPVLTVTNICQGSSSVFQLSWTATPTNGYALFQNGTQYATVPATQLSSTTGAANPGQTFNYFVEAINTTGRLRSNTVTITARNCATPPPAITPPPPPPAAAATVTLNTPSVQCFSNGYATVTLTWSFTGSPGPLTIVRDGTSVVANSADPNARTVQNQSVPQNTTHTYIINFAGNTRSSNQVSVAIPNCAPATPPPPPQPLTLTLSASPGCTGSTTQAGLLWSGTGTGSSYTVTRNGIVIYSQTVDTAHSQVGYTDRAISVGSNYTYQVTARLGSRTGLSNSINLTAVNCTPATPPPPPPAPPPPPPPVAACNPRNIISWSPVAGATSYQVFRTDKSSPFATVSGLSATDTDLVPGQRANYYVVARDATRSSSQSNIITITSDTCIPETPRLRNVTTNCPCAIP